ncbi:TIGR03943 family putative permease subunit [Cryptosporangium japonicum]|uniref:TIGR03943 family protein n=1 Tax=Cryptosporangium japonicum TaxID=80872 RepID=A0ABP3ER74_9ACTN
MNREAQSIVLLLIGGALLRLTVFSDVYLRYVKPGLRWYLVAAGAVLVVAGAITLWRDLFGEERPHAGPKVAWLLLLPVLTIFLIGPPALGSYAVEKQGAAAVQQPRSDLPPLPGGDPVRLSVLDYVTRALWEDGASFRGRQVRLTGFVTVDDSGTAYLTRIVLSCCAADGRPLKVALAGVPPATLERDVWITVVGGYDPTRHTDPVSNETVPTIAVRTLTRIPPPPEPYDR